MNGFCISAAAACRYRKYMLDSCFVETAGRFRLVATQNRCAHRFFARQERRAQNDRLWLACLSMHKAAEAMRVQILRPQEYRLKTLAGLSETRFSRSLSRYG